jgi:hypothetical protein
MPPGGFIIRLSAGEVVPFHFTPLDGGPVEPTPTIGMFGEKAEKQEKSRKADAKATTGETPRTMSEITARQGEPIGQPKRRKPPAADGDPAPPPKRRRPPKVE